MIILFIDFDGVLHPVKAEVDQLFRSIGLLEQVLRDHPHVRVVISSSWKDIHPLDEMQEYFAEDVRAQVVDVIPRHYPLSQVPKPLRDHERHAACHAWLRRRKVDHLPWLALEDDAWRFGPGTPNVIVIDGSRGMNADDARILRERIIALAGSDPLLPSHV